MISDRYRYIHTHANADKGTFRRERRRKIKPMANIRCCCFVFAEGRRPCYARIAYDFMISIVAFLERQYMLCALLT